MLSTSPARYVALSWSLVAVVLLSPWGSFARAQESAGWEMRVCAPPANPPMSSRAHGGFNNDVARILADELGARLTFEWTRLDRENLERTLMAGECDMVVGVAESASGVLSTVPYLRAPYVFVSRADRNVSVTSLDDPRLADLTIGTYQSGIPSVALEKRGIVENVREYAPLPSPDGPDRSAGVLEAVVEEDVDVGIVYGPDAVGQAGPGSVELRLEPVRPEVDVGPTLLQHFRTWTIGVRPYDEALRDRLNIALAERWEDVQEAIASYRVPQSDITRPTSRHTARTNIGVIVPAATSGRVPRVRIGEAGRRGAELAENELAQGASGGGEDVRILFASAPTDAAARRAAERLIATEDVVGLVGGFGEQQAHDLSKIAAEGDTLFFNVAAVGTGLRTSTCPATTFHVEAGAAMYADAALDWFGQRGARRWFVVHQETAAGELLLEHLRRSGDGTSEAVEIVGAAAVEASTFVFTNTVADIAESRAEAVLVALPTDQQEQFLAQAARREGAPAMVTVPFPDAQTREHLFRLRTLAADSAGTARPVLWDASLASGSAVETNEAYLSRTGRAMDPTAWATYAAVRILYDAALHASGNGAAAMVSYLTADGRTFEVGKGVPVSFRAWNHQLRQPLYLVRIDPQEIWPSTGRGQAALAEVVGQRPEASTLTAATDPQSALDRYGIGPEEASCRD